MKKGIYRAVALKGLNVTRLVDRLRGGRVVAAIDVAKVEQFCALMDERGRVHVTVKWKHPRESREFVELVSQVGEECRSVEVAMEPTSTYGDVLRWALVEAGFEVFRVSPKRCHDAAEVYDGVPSLHDAKAAAIVGKLHLDGASERWPFRTEHERCAVALVRTLGLYEGQVQRGVNRLEAQLARYWPELTQHLAVSTATLLELIGRYGGPHWVARDETTARRISGRGHSRQVVLPGGRRFVSPARNKTCQAISPQGPL